MQEPGSRRSPDLRLRRQRLADFLRDRREGLGMSKLGVAAKLGVGRWTYAKWEDGTSSVPAEFLPALANALCADFLQIGESLHLISRAAA